MGVKGKNHGAIETFTRFSCKIKTTYFHKQSLFVNLINEGGRSSYGFVDVCGDLWLDNLSNGVVEWL
jgi:hypothetical protein